MTRASRVPFDIAIAGGGPAGTFAAILLRRSGARVALVDAGAPAMRVEGLAPRVAALLGAHGLPADGVSPPTRRHARWGAMDAAPNAEHLVERGAFDAGLRAAAQAEGVAVIQGVVAGVAPGAIALRGGRTVRAGLAVEARGRRAPAPRSARRGPATLAVAGMTGPDRGQGAAIIACPEGWIWRADLPGRGRWVQVVLDAAAARSGLGAAWARMMRDAGEHAPFPDAPRICAAELRLTAPELDPALPRIGDAAAAMDPLSGHGMFWALSSALALGPVIDAIAAGRADLAQRFHRDRVAATFLRQARIGRDFHRLVDAHADAPFWAPRRAWPDDAPAHRAVAAPRRGARVTVENGRLTEVATIVTPEEPDGVAFLLGRPVGPILDRLRAGAPPRADFPAAIIPDAPEAEALAIHDWLVARDALGPLSHDTFLPEETC